MTPSKAPGAHLLLCGRCKGPIGQVLGNTLLLHDRGGARFTWVAEEPAEGEVRVWCQGCKAYGSLNVPEAVERGKTEKKVRLHLRWIYVGEAR